MGAWEFIPMRKKAETALIYMIVLLLGPAWREKMPLPSHFLSHISGLDMGKVWHWKDGWAVENRKCAVLGKG